MWLADEAAEGGGGRTVLELLWLGVGDVALDKFDAPDALIRVDALVSFGVVERTDARDDATEVVVDSGLREDTVDTAPEGATDALLDLSRLLEASEAPLNKLLLEDVSDLATAGALLVDATDSSGSVTLSHCLQVNPSCHRLSWLKQDLALHCWQIIMGWLGPPECSCPAPQPAAHQRKLGDACRSAFSLSFRYFSIVSGSAWRSTSSCIREAPHSGQDMRCQNLLFMSERIDVLRQVLQVFIAWLHALVTALVGKFESGNSSVQTAHSRVPTPLAAGRRWLVMVFSSSSLD